MSRAVGIAIIWFGFALAMGCEYRETVGRAGVPRSDAATAGADACVGAACEVASDCSNFAAPTGDCTLGQSACDFDSDCEATNSSCNGATKRCFKDTDRCVGTPCRLDGDCASSERCNNTASACYEFNADQRCMPCFLSSSDCGLQTCDVNLDRCR